VQAWDRYAYVNNNPLRYNDPSGHSVDCAIGEPNCRGGRYVSPPSPKTVFEKALDGDTRALIELLTPTHGGLRGQVEIAIPVFGVFGASVSVGGNIVYNYRSNQLAANLDWAVEPGVGIGGGISTTGGPLIGWLSMNVEDATSGFSGILSGTAAAEAAGTVAITFPLDKLESVHVDPYYGQVPFTVFAGGGVGGGYAGLGGGINGTFTYQGQAVYVDLSRFLPWNWGVEK
jgi:hypothetical protein